MIKPVLAAATLIAQSIFFLGFGFLIFDLLTLPDDLIRGANTSTEEVAGYIVETMASYRSAIGSGIIGAFVAWLLILKGRYWARWYLATNRVFGWLWMPFIPVGTLLGALLLSSRSHAIESQDAT